MAHARHNAHHVDTPFPGPKCLPLTAWNASEDPLNVHPDRLDGYLCYAGAVIADTCSNGVARSRGVLLDNVQVAGKRRWREGPSRAREEGSEYLSSFYYEEQTENSKRMCMRECYNAELSMDSTPTHLHGNNLPIPDLSTPMDTVAMATTTNHCSNFHHKKLQLYSLAEAGIGCHHSQMGLSSIDCHRCLAGQPGHLDHILHIQQEGMDTLN